MTKESDFDFSDPDEDLHVALRRLDEALKKPATGQLAETTHPISISDLPREVSTSEAFRVLVERYGWPNNLQDGGITPPQQFESDEAFLRALTPYDTFSVGQNLSEQPGPRHVVSSYLFRLLSTPAINHPREAQSVSGIYGLLATKHRAELIAPELFQSLTVILPKLKERYVATSHVSDEGVVYDRDNLADYLRTEEGAPVLTALRTAHQIMGRLVKADDRDQLIRAVGDTESASRPVTAADDIVFREPQ